IDICTLSLHDALPIYGDGSGVGTIEFHLPDEKKIMVFEPENRPQIVENTMDFFVRKQGELQRRGMEGPETERQRLRNILKSPQRSEEHTSELQSRENL